MEGYFWRLSPDFDEIIKVSKNNAISFSKPQYLVIWKYEQNVLVQFFAIFRYNSQVQNNSRICIWIFY